MGKDGPDFYLMKGRNRLKPNQKIEELGITAHDIIKIKSRLKGGASGQHLIQTETNDQNLDSKPWEGMTTTASGAVVHLRKYCPRGIILKELMDMELTPDNLAIIYTSVYLDSIV